MGRKFCSLLINQLFQINTENVTSQRYIKFYMQFPLQKTSGIHNLKITNSPIYNNNNNNNNNITN